jgi:hypothetical protein
MSQQDQQELLSIRIDSPSLAEPITEEILQFGHRVDFPNRRFDIVLDATILDRFAIEEEIARSPIGIAGLPDGTNVAQDSLTRDAKSSPTIFGGQEIPLPRLSLDENARKVSMTRKADAVETAGDVVHLPFVVNIFGEEELVQRVARRTMNVKNLTLTMGRRQTRQKIQSSLSNLAIPDRGFEQSSRPEDAHFRTLSESIRIEENSLIVISE